MDVSDIDNWDLKLVNRILSKIKHNGFLSAITKGERGYGKSIYNIKTMAYVYRHLGCNEEEAWDKALECIIFTPDEFLKKIAHNLRYNIISPVWCIDDATVHFSSYLYFINLYETSLLNATFDTIRTAVNAILLNCPDKHRLLSGLRNYDDYEVSIYMDIKGGYERKAVGIKWYSLPSGDRKFRKEFEDYFSCYLPNDIYSRYMEKRTRYLKEVSDELRELQEKLNVKKSKKMVEGDVDVGF